MIGNGADERMPVWRRRAHFRRRPETREKGRDARFSARRIGGARRRRDAPAKRWARFVWSLRHGGSRPEHRAKKWALLFRVKRCVFEILERDAQLSPDASCSGG